MGAPIIPKTSEDPVVATPEPTAPAGGPEPNTRAADAAAKRRKARRFEFVERYALVATWLTLIVVFSVLKPDTFATSANWGTILGSQAVLAVLALALVIPMTGGDYDLSVAYNLTLTSMLIAILNVRLEWPILPAILVSLLVAGCIGLINGLITTIFEIESIIVTLGTGTFIGGIVLWISNSETISGVSTTLVDWVIVHQVLGVPIAFFYVLALAAVLWYVFEFTPVGRRLLIVGRGRSVARLSGIRVSRVRIGAFVCSGLLAGLAGVLYAGTSGAADPSSGIALLLPSFAAAFLGSTTIKPGRFNPWGTLVAVYFLITGINGMQLLGADSYVQDLFYGGALVVAVAISQLVRGRKGKEI